MVETDSRDHSTYEPATDNPPITRRGRTIHENTDINSCNAWDDIEWTEEMIESARERVDQQKNEATTSLNQVIHIEEQVGFNWDAFYQAHSDKFFKDRRWIFSEFHEILPHLKQGGPPCNLLELGCGAGNALVHIVDYNKSPNLRIYCCDISQHAIELLKRRSSIFENSTQVTAFAADICKDYHSVICNNIPTESIDFITLIFTLSALKPESMQDALTNLAKLLKPGGMVFFRDYAQYDMTQLRFKAKSYLSENYYRRADGTTSYFFTLDVIDKLMTSAGLSKVELKKDNRLLVNRSRSLHMCRCWIQAKYAK